MKAPDVCLSQDLLCFLHSDRFNIFIYAAAGFHFKYGAQIAGVQVDGASQIIQGDLFPVMFVDILLG